MKRLFAICYLLFAICIGNADAAQSVIARGTTVAARVAPTGLYSQECHDAYYSCMGQFCSPDNTNGGACSCSDENAGYLAQWDASKKIRDDAARLETVEVERIQAGANADIIFSGTREYDADGNVVVEKTAEEEKQEKRAALMALFDTTDTFENVFETGVDGITDKSGAELYQAAHEMCAGLMPANCATDTRLLTQMYSMQIRSDCAAFKNATAVEVAAANAVLADAQTAVRGALRDSLNAANEFNRGECLVNFKGCMQGADACGANWAECVAVTASAAMRTNAPNSDDYFHIADATLNILNSKRNICERILDKCVAVRDTVWTDFLREAAPTLKFAELNAESKMRSSCLADISGCIQTACREDIAGKGIATMDSCLSRPEMVQSFCKVQLDPCLAMEPKIWDYVKDRLAAMRVDACTAEVKECFTSDDRCGSDFSRCIGMDYAYIHEICPIDKLVVCRAADPDFNMSKLDSMLMGMYLNIDNSLLETCQNKLETKMQEICGSTTDCNKFAADDTMGTGSLQPQKVGTVYRVTGMISFGNIKMGDGSNPDKAGVIDIEDYLTNVRELHRRDADKGIISSIESELQNIQGTVNRVVGMIEQDPEVGYCVSGRNLSQITGRDEATSARFPNLLNRVKMQIAISALRRAQDNYNAKFTTAVADATKNASADLAQYMCQRMAATGGDLTAPVSGTDTPLTPPYAISYDVDMGLTIADLTRGGRGTSTIAGATFENSNSANYLGSIISDNGRYKSTHGDTTRETWSTFNRETRNCHFCSSTITQSCKSKGSRGILGLWDSRGLDCTTAAPVEKCEDIPM